MGKGKSIDLMMVAGEPSGDRHAAKLASELRSAKPELQFQFYGSAGPLMRESGIEATVKADDLSIMGLPEIARALPMFLSVFRKLVRTAEERKPDAVILIDFPEFNLRLAKALKKRGHTVIYYISPQLWAWRKYRVKTIKKYVDLMLVILPFEKKWYEQQGVDKVEYVGHPLANEVMPSLTKEQFCEKHGLESDKPLIALLPGSRSKEIEYIFPEMVKAANLMNRKNSGIQFVAAMAREKNLMQADAIYSKIVNKPEIKFVAKETYDALNAADAAAVASGTATLETGIIGTPMAIVYKGLSLNYKLLTPLIDVEHFGLINLIAEDRIVNEYIQDDLKPEVLADELERLLITEINKNVRVRLKKATERLGDGGATKKAAEAIFRHLNV